MQAWKGLASAVGASYMSDRVLSGMYCISQTVLRWFSAMSYRSSSVFLSGSALMPYVYHMFGVSLFLCEHSDDAIDVAG